ncbi:hypothetical protein HKD37_09G024972 [Glycine soja]
MKDSLINIENLGSLFNSPFFDTSVKIAYGLGLILGEPSTFSIPFPPLPTESVDEPSTVQEDVPHVRIPTPIVVVVERTLI